VQLLERERKKNKQILLYKCCGGKRERKKRKRERIAVFFLLSQVFNFVFLLQLSLPSLSASLSLNF
jgi:hypothetical protein